MAEPGNKSVPPGMAGPMSEPGSQVHPQAPAAGALSAAGPPGPIGAEPSMAAGAGMGEAQVVPIGAIYKLEGFIDGSPVVYIGEANEIRTRLGPGHRWLKLIRDPRTTISRRRVFGRPDKTASGRGTELSAQKEALRSQEEKALRETEEQVKGSNESLQPGEQPTSILNEKRPAAGANMELWQQRHMASSEEQWLEIKAPGASTITFRAFIGLQVVQLILDALLAERNRRMSRYIWGTYVFLEADDQTAFTLEEDTAWWGLVTHYRKNYISGNLRGTSAEIGAGEFKTLKDEAHALYGEVDAWGDFVPGLLVPELPVTRITSPLNMSA